MTAEVEVNPEKECFDVSTAKDAAGHFLIVMNGKGNLGEQSRCVPERCGIMQQELRLITPCRGKYLPPLAVQLVPDRLDQFLGIRLKLVALLKWIG